MLFYIKLKLLLICYKYRNIFVKILIFKVISANLLICIPKVYKSNQLMLY